jgi:hypothetical protein
VTGPDDALLVGVHGDLDAIAQIELGYFMWQRRRNQPNGHDKW